MIGISDFDYVWLKCDLGCRVRGNVKKKLIFLVEMLYIIVIDFKLEFWEFMSNIKW